MAEKNIIPADKPHRTGIIALTLAALGIVYGDIGTSPLYALRICFTEHGSAAPTPENVLGVLSLIIWAVILLVSVKYMLYVLRADNKGEGGILALMNLSRRGLTGAKAALITGLGLFGAALLYGDSLITPVISVLSALEGLTVIDHSFTPFIVPISLVVLIALFAFQRLGTSGIGTVFGPVMILWFLSLAVLGMISLVETPYVLNAFNPLHAVNFALHNGGKAFLTLGGVFLVLTGGEAIYADIGHMGKGAVRLGWYVLVLPALLMNYLGQGALLLRDPANLSGLFFRLAPAWAVLPMTLLSTAATVIASQAVISGAFSLARQSVQLSYNPRMNIIHTSHTMIGQVYVPVVNWLLLAGTIILTLSFQKSDNLAAAYGVAVSCTMLITTVLMFVMAVYQWKWNIVLAAVLSCVFVVIDLCFFGANIMKVMNGGFISLLIALAVFIAMIVWRRGRELVKKRIDAESLPVALFVRDVVSRHPRRTPGTGIFLSGNPEGIPRTLLHNFKFNQTLHETTVLMTVQTVEEPTAPEAERISVIGLGEGLFRVIVKFGYMQQHNLPSLFERVVLNGVSLNALTATYFLGKESFVPAKKPLLWPPWRGLFIFLARNARDASAYYNLPVNRVIELGMQMEV
ncbi:MAG: potassium transporter Kup [Spirochaetota bacterium]